MNILKTIKYLSLACVLAGQMIILSAASDTPIRDAAVAVATAVCSVKSFAELNTALEAVTDVNKQALSGNATSWLQRRVNRWLAPSITPILRDIIITQAVVYTIAEAPADAPKPKKLEIGSFGVTRGLIESKCGIPVGDDHITGNPIFDFYNKAVDNFDPMVGYAQAIKGMTSGDTGLASFVGEIKDRAQAEMQAKIEALQAQGLVAGVVESAATLIDETQRSFTEAYTKFTTFVEGKMSSFMQALSDRVSSELE